MPPDPHGLLSGVSRGMAQRRFLERYCQSQTMGGQGLYLIITSLHGSPNLRIFNEVARLAYVDGNSDLEWAEKRR